MPPATSSRAVSACQIPTSGSQALRAQCRWNSPEVYEIIFGMVDAEGSHSLSIFVFLFWERCFVRCWTGFSEIFFKWNPKPSKQHTKRTFKNLTYTVKGKAKKSFENVFWTNSTRGWLFFDDFSEAPQEAVREKRSAAKWRKETAKLFPQIGSS